MLEKFKNEKTKHDYKYFNVDGLLDTYQNGKNRPVKFQLLNILVHIMFVMKRVKLNVFQVERVFLFFFLLYNFVSLNTAYDGYYNYMGPIKDGPETCAMFRCVERAAIRFRVTVEGLASADASWVSMENCVTNVLLFRVANTVGE